MPIIHYAITLLKDTLKAWSEDRVSRLAAILAFYSALSLSPLLVLIVALSGALLGDETFRIELINRVNEVLGSDGQQWVSDLIDSATRMQLGLTASAISIVVIIFGASGVFRHLYEALNLIWQVEPYPDQSGPVMFLIKQGIGVLMVIGMGFLFLASLMATTAVTAIARQVEQYLPGTQYLTSAANILASLLLLTVLFALVFKYVPAIQVRWRDILPGAAATAVLFVLGESLIAFYFRESSIGSVYGAAGTLVIILLWMYYSAMIVLFGAELTYAYTHRFGAGTEPADHADGRSAAEPTL